MKPRTVIQKQVVAACNSLPTINEKQSNWSFESCVKHTARRTKKYLACLSCGDIFGEHDKYLLKDAKKCNCPHCGRTLQIKDTTKHKFKDTIIWGILTICKGFQVIRFFEMKINYKVGEAARYYNYEIVQKWIREDGKHVTRALRLCSIFYSNSWIYSSDIQIRKESYLYNIVPDAYYPVRKYLPILKRNGFIGNFHNIEPINLFTSLLKDNIFETMFKAGQMNVLKYAADNDKSLAPYWDSLKICVRNHYNITNPIAWFDYIDLLNKFTKDVRNPKYVCPLDLIKEHDRFVEKKMLIDTNKETLEDIIKSEPIYEGLKRSFLDLEFSDGEIHISVLNSVKDFFTESEIMHHCVFSNRYYLKPDSLVMTARVNGDRIETVEFSLRSFQIVQSRGRFNMLTEYHDQIIELVKKNIPEIMKRVTA